MTRAWGEVRFSFNSIFLNNLKVVLDNSCGLALKRSKYHPDTILIIGTNLGSGAIDHDFTNKTYWHGFQLHNHFYLFLVLFSMHNPFYSCFFQKTINSYVNCLSRVSDLNQKKTRFRKRGVSSCNLLVVVARTTATHSAKKNVLTPSVSGGNPLKNCSFNNEEYFS